MMKKILYSFFVYFLCALNLSAYNSPESIVYDNATKAFFVSNAGNGDIFKIVNDTMSVFVKRSAPKGMTILNNTLYVADVTNIAAYNLNDASLVFDKLVPNAVFLNDICIDSTGNLYATDTQNGCIYIKAANDTEIIKFAVKDSIPSPNGIIYEKSNNRLLVVSYNTPGKVYSISLTDSSLTEVLNTGYNNLDGLTKDIYGNYYISSWGNGNSVGKVIRYNSKFDLKSASVVKDSLNGPADIFYCNDSLRLYIPVMNQDTVMSMLLKVPDAPVPTYPKDSAQLYDFNVEFDWNGVTDVIKYELQVSKINDFSTIAFDTTTANEFTASYAFDMQTEYYWRVRALGALGYGDWSSIMTFKTGGKNYSAPILIAPADKSENLSLTPTFQWTKSAPNVYDLQISTDKNFSTVDCSVKTLNDTIYTLDVALKPNKTYFWRVVTYNGDNKSPWSEVRQFSTYRTAPDAPNLVYPGNYLVNTYIQPTFQWLLTQNTNYYKFQIKGYDAYKPSDSSVATYTIQLSEYNNGWKIPDVLNYHTNYYWTVLSGNDIGESAWSETFEFSTPNRAPESVDNSNASIKELTLLPNPASDIVNIEFYSTIGGEGIMYLYDINGNMVMNKKFSSNVGYNPEFLNCELLPNGIYLIKIQMNNSMLTQKLIIDKDK